MDSGKSLESSPAQKVYHPSPRRYLKFEVITSVFPVVSFGLILLVILLIPIFTWHPEQLFSALLIGLVFIGPFEAFFVFYFLWRTHVGLVRSVDWNCISPHLFTRHAPWYGFSSGSTA